MFICRFISFDIMSLIHVMPNSIGYWLLLIAEIGFQIDKLVCSYFASVNDLDWNLNVIENNVTFWGNIKRNKAVSRFFDLRMCIISKFCT